MGFITIDAIDENNCEREVLVDAADPPKFGEFFDYEGELLRRLPRAPELRVKKSIDAVKAWSLPRRKAALKQGMALAPRYDSKGVPVFDSRKEISEYVAKHNDNPNNGTTIAWDPDGNE